jgi:hypothetical protein
MTCPTNCGRLHRLGGKRTPLPDPNTSHILIRHLPLVVSRALSGLAAGMRFRLYISMARRLTYRRKKQDVSGRRPP